MQKTQFSLAGKWILCLGAMLALSLLFFRSQPPSSPSSENEPQFAPQAQAKPQRQPEEQASLRCSRWPASADSDPELLCWARELVAQSPEQTLAWIADQTDSAFRERLLFVALRAWGEKNPHSAVAWALAQDQEWRFKRMEAALTGAVAQPAAALAIGRKLLAEDPLSGNAYGTALVGALNRANQFQTAFQLAADAPAEVRSQWLGLTLRCWAEAQPQEALQAWNSVQSEELRRDFFAPLATGWAAKDPGELAQYAITLAPGEARTFALDQAMEHWLNRDPAAMGEWLNQLPPGPEADRAAAELITHTDSVNRSPEVALSWVQAIGDLELRRSSLAYVLKQWSESDPQAAQHYVANTGWLDPQQQQELLNSLQNPPPRVSGGDNE